MKNMINNSSPPRRPPCSLYLVLETSDILTFLSSNNVPCDQGWSANGVVFEGAGTNSFFRSTKAIAGLLVEQGIGGPSLIFAQAQTIPFTKSMSSQAASQILRITSFHLFPSLFIFPMHLHIRICSELTRNLPLS